MTPARGAGWHYPQDTEEVELTPREEIAGVNLAGDTEVPSGSQEPQEDPSEAEAGAHYGEGETE